MGIARLYNSYQSEVIHYTSVANWAALERLFILDLKTQVGEIRSGTEEHMFSHAL